MADTKLPLDFESNMKELEQIVYEMESGELSLESALAKFERGIALSRRAGAILTEAEQKVTILTTDKAIGESLESFGADQAKGA